MEAGFEVSKILAQAGYDMNQPAFSITWGQIAEEVAHTLADHGLPVDRLEEDNILGLVVESADVMKNEDVLFWRESVRAIIQENIGDLLLENNQN
jgi:hypothetical protein